jgi:hypothetical protein
MLFGPAYKGFRSSPATAAAMAEHEHRDLPFAFNRKEAKDHGEGGTIVGAPLKGRVLIVDDVITAGTAIRESIDIIRAHGAEPAGVLIALDREERGRGERSAVQEVQDTMGTAGHCRASATRFNGPPRRDGRRGYSRVRPSLPRTLWRLNRSSAVMRITLWGRWPRQNIPGGPSPAAQCAP